jgi:hypothetical protein
MVLGRSSLAPSGERGQGLSAAALRIDRRGGLRPSGLAFQCRRAVDEVAREG